MNHILQVAENQIKNYLKIIGIYEDIYENKEVTEVLINTNKKIFTKVLGKAL